MLLGTAATGCIAAGVMAIVLTVLPIMDTGMVVGITVATMYTDVNLAATAAAEVYNHVWKEKENRPGYL